MQNLLMKDEVYPIVGAAMDVYNNLGSGFLEAVYQEALAIEFSVREIPYTPQRELPLTYKGKPLKKTYVADFLAYEKVIVEIKAIPTITSRDERQVLNYLKASGCRVGVLLNFGSHDELVWRRKVL